MTQPEITAQLLKLTLDVGWILRLDLRGSTTSDADLIGLSFKALSVSTLPILSRAGASFPLLALDEDALLAGRASTEVTSDENKIGA